MKPEHIIMHHSATKDSSSLSWAAIRKAHMEKGWDGIGYHYGIELVGDGYEILIGRDLDKSGAHCRGMNSKSFGICLVGNFDIDKVPQEQWTIALALAMSLCSLFEIPIENVHGHREYSQTHCPGKNFDILKFRRDLVRINETIHKGEIS